MTFDLHGKVAVVTGAARGDRAALGAAFAKALAQAGAKVVVGDVKDASDVAEDIRSMGGEALACKVDVASEAQIKDMVDQTVDRFGRLDILVNNAGVGSNIPPIPVTELSADDWDNLMRVNARGPFLCVKAVVPQMKRQGYGKIINLGSTTMMTGLTHRLHYVASKGAILAMTRSLAGELGVHGIRVNAAAFGLVNSALTEESFKKTPDREAQVLGKRALPLHYWPEDLGGTIVYLASPASDHMTGQCLVVNAGEFYY